MSNAVSKTHYRKAFDSPYLSSADIVEPTVLTVARVTLEIDRTKKTKDLFNTAHFAEKELRPGEALKPMILNASNSKTMKGLTRSAFIEDWTDVPVTIYVDHNVRFGRDTVEGLRISPHAPDSGMQQERGKSAKWVKTANELETMQQYDAAREKLIADYDGDANNVPRHVQTAFMNAKTALMPKD